MPGLACVVAAAVLWPAWLKSHPNDVQDPFETSGSDPLDIREIQQTLVHWGESSQDDDVLNLFIRSSNDIDSC